MGGRAARATEDWKHLGSVGREISDHLTAGKRIGRRRSAECRVIVRVGGVVEDGVGDVDPKGVLRRVFMIFYFFSLISSFLYFISRLKSK